MVCFKHSKLVNRHMDKSKPILSNDNARSGTGKITVAKIEALQLNALLSTVCQTSLRQITMSTKILVI